ncbi:PrgI family protein [Sphaerisporangium sp. TRM90804]|uniref:PrgI family protein n=1 Tax=Sphaerisporangium sp. TRM90804 TaxID=3031113 RepID=UPI00244C79E7|nr:PrgI family protein [Sphaerisporangium sp. TRM90804]MDH2426473.1 PrgI family protein [Sphaerisporangium sp. TRM90804]
MTWSQPIRIPADVEQADKIMANFTARQLGILTGTGAILYGGYLGFGETLPPLVFLAVALPIAVTGILLAIGRHDGISLDRYVLAAISFHYRPKRFVTGSVDAPRPPAWMAASASLIPSPLRLPARGVSVDGLIDLGPDGVAALAEVSTVSFALRTPDEQDALVAVFGRWLNSLPGPVQILVRAERVDLTTTVAALQETAPDLPHPALEQAAREHAAFLRELTDRHELLRRQVLLVAREPSANAGSRATSAARALRRLEEASRVLGACGLDVRLLDARAVAALLASCFDPTAPPIHGDRVSSPGEVITRGEHR